MSYTEFSESEFEALPENPEGNRLVFPRWGLVLGPAGLAYPWPDAPWAIAVQVGLTIATAYALFCWTSVFHETVHHTYCKSKRRNIWVGRVIGAVIGAPYTTYRETHIRHHAYLNKPVDWELWPYSDPTKPLWFRRLFVWFDLACGFASAPLVYGRIFFHKNSPLTSPAIRATVRKEYLACVMLWGTVIGLTAWYGAWLFFLKVWGIPHFLAGVMQTGRKLTEHLGMASYDPLQGTRTVIGKNFWSRWCTFVNFDIFIHGPHHRHPRISHDQLAGKMQDYVAHNPDVHYPIYGSYWRATWSMLPCLFKNPGVGVNAGAALPDSTPTDNGNMNFTADVVQVAS